MRKWSCFKLEIKHACKSISNYEAGLRRQLYTSLSTSSALPSATVYPEMTTSCLVDQTKSELARITEAEAAQNQLDNKKYYNQAHGLLWIGVAKPISPYVVDTSDLSPKLINELHIGSCCTMDDTQDGSIKASRDKLGADAYDKSVKTNKKTQQKKREFMVFKYAGHEAVIVKGKPLFIRIDNKLNIKGIDKIEEETRILVPPHLENYPYTPYEFESVAEIQRYLDRAKHETIDSLYEKAKTIASDYNNQSIEKVRLLAIDIIVSYFQDRLPTTHYDIVLGDNGNGKSTWGETYASVGYRARVLTDPNAANILRILGCIEPGQCTIVADEAGLEQDQDLLAALKTGYQLRGKISKVNDTTRNPEFFSTYCFKIIISDKLTNIREIKGVRDRSFDFTCYRGRPNFDIKETLEPQGNPERQARLNTLMDFRRLILMYRLLHLNDHIQDIDVGVDGRDKELVKPVIQIFYATKAQTEVTQTLQHFLNIRNEKKDISIEPILCSLTLALMTDKNSSTVYLKDTWSELKNKIEGHCDDKKPNEYHTEEYGTIYNKTISNIFENVFGGKPKRRNDGITYTFNRSELERILTSYGICNTITVVGKSDDGDGSDDNRKEVGVDTERENNTSYIFINNKNNSKSRSGQVKNDIDKPSTSTGLPSLSSLSSPEEVALKLRRRREALRAEQGGGK